MPTRHALHRANGGATYIDRQRERQRTRSPSRTYGRRWQRLRAVYLATHPICECDDNCMRPATVVDHRVPHNGDAALMYDWDNLQAMTKPCHDAKTARHDGGFGNPRR